MRGERFSVLLLSICWGLSEAQPTSTLQEKLAALERRLDISENEVLQLKSLIAGQPAVAFSVALMDEGARVAFVGRSQQKTTVLYNKVFANVGNGYNPATGQFTAMVKGMYYFRFTMSTAPVPNTVMCLVKNSEELACVYDVKSLNGYDNGSNGAVVAMAAGDSARVRLEPNRTVAGGTWPYTTFSGFLLFPQ